MNPYNVRRTVQLDMLGDRKLQFTDDAVWYFTNDVFVMPLPSFIVSGTMIRNRPIRYRDIRWVGTIIKRQWSMLAFGLPGALLGLYMVGTSLRGEFGALVTSFILLTLFGLIPLGIFAMGRRFIAIASDTEVICFPADRKKKQSAKALATLEENCTHDDVEWAVA